MGEIDTVRKGLMVSAALAREIDDFRFERRYRTDADALRALIEAGLRASKQAPTDADA